MTVIRKARYKRPEITVLKAKTRMGSPVLTQGKNLHQKINRVPGSNQEARITAAEQANWGH